MTFRTRFAPSPTGPLHLGHAYSALLAYEMAAEQGGEFLLRIEDTDLDRARPEWEAQIYQDLKWLGIGWSEPVRRQSEHLPRYAAAIGTLSAKGLIYPCSCSRADVRDALSAPQEGVPTHGPDGIIYPGTCRSRDLNTRQPGDAVRLNISKALKHLDGLDFTETGLAHPGTHHIALLDLVTSVGDIVLARKGSEAAAYHLAVVMDDADQRITHVVRGEDLFEATQIHVLLQNLLGLPTPIYHHHKLIRDENGKRLAKRDDARAIAKYREDGATLEDIRALIGL